MKMKKLAAALCAAALSLTAVSFSAFAADTDGVKIDGTNFPDENFRIGMQEAFDTNDDNVFSDDEINKTTHISCGWSGIKDLKGIEYFTELIGFSCSSNQITELDMSANKKLKELFCYTLHLEKPIDLSKNTSLEVLHCGRSGITELDVSNNKELYFLNCSYNDIAQLDISQNTKLKELDCVLTDISELDISNNPYLLKAYTEGRKEEHTDNDTVNDIIEDTVYYIYDGDPDSNDNEDYYDLRVNSETKIITETKADGVAIDETNFPDETFREYVKRFDTDENGSFSADEIAAVTKIDCSWWWIGSLEGIEYFTALEYLDCSGNQLTEFDVSKNTALTYLDCGNNELTTLDVSNNTKLETLYCSDNSLKELDVSKNTALTHLDCGKNELATPDLSNNIELSYLICNNNNLTELDISENTKLEWLFCDDNSLKELDVSNNTALIRMGCNDNQLTSLDVSKNTALEDLYCNNNSISALDLSNNIELLYLICDNNNLTALDVSKNNALKYLYCNSNKLTEIDISNNPNIIIAYTKGFEPEYEPLPDGINEKSYDIFCLRWDKTTKVITGAAQPEEKPVTLTDEKTKVAVTGMLDGLKLNVKPTEAKDAVAAYDITLTDADNKVVQPNGKIEISIPCETKGLYVYHIKDDGTKEYIPSKYVDGCYVFTTDQLSVYALMKDKPEEKPVTTPEENKPSTDDNKPSAGDTKPTDDSNKPTGSAAGIAFAGIALAGAALMVSKKRK